MDNLGKFLKYRKKPLSQEKDEGGFSLIELLTAMTILSVLMLMMTTLLDQVQQSWRMGTDRVSQFREARVAFDLISKNLSQASTNTYLDYELDPATNQPLSYKKRTDLQFKVISDSPDSSKDYNKLKQAVPGELSGHAVFFQAPLGYSLKYRNLNNLYNGRGFLVVYGNDDGFRPEFVETDRYRFRLMEFRPPAEENQVFEDATDEVMKNGNQEMDDWWNQGLRGDFSSHLNPLAENIALLVAAPMDSINATGVKRLEAGNDIAKNYAFDSNKPARIEFGQQVPPLIKVTMVAIDEGSAVRLEDEYQKSLPKIFTASGFRNAADFEDDVAELAEVLNNKGIGYRVFSTTVMLRAAKWSSEK